MHEISTLSYRDRVITRRYDDPLELVWLATAKRLGLVVRRHPEVFAMTDGHGTLHLSTRDDLDPDDDAAQMILHEICHWLVNGPGSVHEQDWGFVISETIDWREFPCLRVQAALADRVELRAFLAPTSGVRDYYDALGSDPLAPRDDSELETRIVALAKEALARADAPPFAEPLAAALAATAAIHTAVQPFLADYQHDGQGADLPSLWDADARRVP